MTSFGLNHGDVRTRESIWWIYLLLRVCFVTWFILHFLLGWRYYNRQWFYYSLIARMWHSIHREWPYRNRTAKSASSSIIILSLSQNPNNYFVILYIVNENHNKPIKSIQYVIWRSHNLDEWWRHLIASQMKWTRSVLLCSKIVKTFCNGKVTLWTNRLRLWPAPDLTRSGFDPLRLRCGPI